MHRTIYFLIIIISFISSGCENKKSDEQVFNIDPGAVEEKARNVIKTKHPEIELNKYDLFKMFYYYSPDSDQNKQIQVMFWEKERGEPLTENTDISATYGPLEKSLKQRAATGETLNVYPMIDVMLNFDGDINESKVKFKPFIWGALHVEIKQAFPE